MDLSTAGVDGFWAERGVALHGVIARMDSLQDWTVDEDIDGWIIALGEALDSPSFARLMMERVPETVEFLSWISSSKALRVMDAVDEVEMGAAARFVYQASELKDNPVYRTFLEGLDVLSRSKLLSHIFSPQRMALVEAAIKASVVEESA